MKGIYHHCSEAHLKRYLTEFDIALGVDEARRAELALKGIECSRLAYRRTH